MKRFYGIALQPTLFGEVAVVRCWGRIGTLGRTMSVTFPDQKQAAVTFADTENEKRGKGYCLTCRPSKKASKSYRHVKCSLSPEARN